MKYSLHFSPSLLPPSLSSLDSPVGLVKPPSFQTKHCDEKNQNQRVGVQSVSTMTHDLH